VSDNGKPLEAAGLYYYGARYYDPALGRFVSCDPVMGNLSNPQNLNPYVYCLNNPQSYIDKNGEFWQYIFAALIYSAFMTAKSYYEHQKYGTEFRITIGISFPAPDSWGSGTSTSSGSNGNIPTQENNDEYGPIFAYSGYGEPGNIADQMFVATFDYYYHFYNDMGLNGSGKLTEWGGVHLLNSWVTQSGSGTGNHRAPFGLYLIGATEPTKEIGMVVPGEKRGWKAPIYPQFDTDRGKYNGRLLLHYDERPKAGGRVGTAFGTGGCQGIQRPCWDLYHELNRIGPNIPLEIRWSY